MKLKTTLFGNVYQFKDVKEVLAKANELRSGDVLAGVAAAPRWIPSALAPSSPA